MNSRTKATLLVLLIFLTGVLFGGTLVFFWAQPAFPLSRLGPGARQEVRANRPPERSLSYLSDFLALNASQRAELGRILEESRQQLSDINRQSNRRHRVIRSETLEQIRSILEPDQMENFEAFLAQRDQRWQRRRPGPIRRRDEPGDNP